VKQKPTHSTKRLLPLVPKIKPRLTVVTPLALTPAQPLSTNDQELSHFKVFVGTTSRNLGEYIDTPIWCHIVLQASEQDQFFKHAIIALGALNKSHDVTAAIGNLVWKDFGSWKRTPSGCLSTLGQIHSRNTQCMSRTAQKQEDNFDCLSTRRLFFLSTITRTWIWQ
jgi:hypothetical protein